MYHNELIKCTDDIPNIVQWIRLNGDYSYYVKLFNGNAVMVGIESIHRPPSIGVMDDETLIEVEAFAITQLILGGHIQ